MPSVESLRWSFGGRDLRGTFEAVGIGFLVQKTTLPFADGAARSRLSQSVIGSNGRSVETTLI